MQLSNDMKRRIVRMSETEEFSTLVEFAKQRQHAVFGKATSTEGEVMEAHVGIRGLNTLESTARSIKSDLQHTEAREAKKGAPT